MDRKQYWENVYRAKASTELSWYQHAPDISLRLIKSANIQKNQAIIDVGGGTSVLVDCLLNQGFTNISVLDISHSAIAEAQKRLGEKYKQIQWFEEDVTHFTVDSKFTLWHDRAVFHFLTQAKDRQSYVNHLKKQVVKNGHIIIVTFSLEGPKQCSGLEIVRYDSESISSELGKSFSLKQTISETHSTPRQKTQAFSYFYFIKTE